MDPCVARFAGAAARANPAARAFVGEAEGGSADQEGEEGRGGPGVDGRAAGQGEEWRGGLGLDDCTAGEGEEGRGGCGGEGRPLHTLIRAGHRLRASTRAVLRRRTPPESGEEAEGEGPCAVRWGGHWSRALPHAAPHCSSVHRVAKRWRGGRGPVRYRRGERRRKQGGGAGGREGAREGAAGCK